MSISPSAVKPSAIKDLRVLTQDIKQYGSKILYRIMPKDISEEYTPIFRMLKTAQRISASLRRLDAGTLKSVDAEAVRDSRIYHDVEEMRTLLESFPSRYKSKFSIYYDLIVQNCEELKVKVEYVVRMPEPLPSAVRIPQACVILQNRLSESICATLGELAEMGMEMHEKCLLLKGLLE